MGIVGFITLTSIPIILSLGIVTGIFQLCVAKKKILWFTLINIFLLLIFYFIVCYGGYYISLKDVIPYCIFKIFNYSMIIISGFLLFILNCYLINKIYKKTLNDKHGDKQNFIIQHGNNIFRLSYLNLFVCWTIIISIYLSPLYSCRRIEKLDIEKLNEINNYLSNKNNNFVLKQSMFFDKNEIFISSYNYGGIIIHYKNKVKVLNIQTFFYRWKPSSFIFDSEEKIILIKVNKDIFIYNISLDKLYFFNKYLLSDCNQNTSRMGT